MKEKMTFETDRHQVTEGDIVGLTWNCTGAEKVELTIDNGFRATQIPLDIVGSKRFRINRSKGHTALTITAIVDGKPSSKTIKIKVKPIPTTHADTIDDHGRPITKLRQWTDTMRSRIQTEWQSSSQTKKLAIRIVLMLAGVMLISALLPALLPIGIIAVMGYLVWRIMRS